MREARRVALVDSIWWTFLVLLFLPALFVLLAGFFGHSAPRLWSWPTFRFFLEAVRSPVAQRAIVQSGVLAVLSATGGAFGAFLLLTYEWIYRRERLEKISTPLILPMSYPDVIWGFGLLVVFAAVPVAESGFVAVLLVHITFNLGLSAIIIRGRLGRLERATTEAARDCGATFGETLRVVVWPSLAKTFWAAWLLSVVFSLDDFVLTYLVGGTETRTVPLLIYGGLKHGMSGEVAALASMLAVVSIGLLLGAAYLLWRSEERGSSQGRGVLVS